MKVFNRGTMPMKAWIIMKPQNWQVEISPRHVKYLCNLFWKAVPTHGRPSIHMENLHWFVKTPFGRVIWEHGLTPPTHP